MSAWVFQVFSASSACLESASSYQYMRGLGL